MEARLSQIGTFLCVRHEQHRIRYQDYVQPSMYHTRPVLWAKQICYFYVEISMCFEPVKRGGQSI